MLQRSVLTRQRPPRLKHNKIRTESQMCGCRKKLAIAHAAAAPAVGGRVIPTSFAIRAEPEYEVAFWGPRVWRLLHIFAERIGKTGKVIMDNDAALHMNYIIQNLPDVLPCTECAGHAAAYLLANKFAANGKSGADLQSYVREYLFQFHNAVNKRKGKPEITNEEYTTLYKDVAPLTAAESDVLRGIFRKAMGHRIIKSDKYMSWAIQVHKLNLLLGL